MKQITETVEAIEALRREKVDPSLRTVVTPDGVDYAGAGLLIQMAMAALDEGIPGRQRMRVQTSLMALLEGATDLMRWAQYNGYFSNEAALNGYKQAMAALDVEQKFNAELRDLVVDLRQKLAKAEGREPFIAPRLVEAEPALKFDEEAPGGAEPTA